MKVIKYPMDAAFHCCNKLRAWAAQLSNNKCLQEDLHYVSSWRSNLGPSFTLKYEPEVTPEVDNSLNC